MWGQCITWAQRLRLQCHHCAYCWLPSSLQPLLWLSVSWATVHLKCWRWSETVPRMQFGEHCGKRFFFKRMDEHFLQITPICCVLFACIQLAVAMWVDETGTNSSKTQSSSLEGWEFRYDAPQRHCGLREVMLGAGGLENHTSDYYRVK